MFESAHGEGVTAETWEFRLSQEPARLWSVLADTNRLFEALEYPRYAVSDEVEEATGARRRVARSGQGPRSVEWEERPFEWATGQWWRMQRRYAKGPLNVLEATLYLRRSAGGGSIAQYSLTAEANGMRGRTMISSGHLRRMGDLFLRRAEEADDFLAGRSAHAFDVRPPMLTREVLATIDQRAEAAAEVAAAQSDPIFEELITLLKTGSDSDVAEIRPRALAKRLDRSYSAVLDVCLAATEVGLLRRRFSPICPECRRPAVGSDTLSGLGATATCLAERRVFSLDLAQNVELSFFAAPELRAASMGGYCLSGPLHSPHIVLQQELEPGERRALPFQPPAGGYRFRVETASGEIPATAGAWRAPVDLTDAPTPTLLALDDGVAIGGAPSDQALVLENHSKRPLRFILEIRAWRGDAASAASAVMTEPYRRAFPLDAPISPLPAGRAYAVAYCAVAGQPTRDAVGPRETTRRYAALQGAAVELAKSDGGVLLRRGPEAGVGLFSSVYAAAAFATALREAARAWLSGRNFTVAQELLEPPEFGEKRKEAVLDLSIAIDEGAVVLSDTGLGVDAAGPGLARAEALALAQAREGGNGMIVCAEAAAAPEADGLWPDGAEEVNITLDPQSAPLTVVRYP